MKYFFFNTLDSESRKDIIYVAIFSVEWSCEGFLVYACIYLYTHTCVCVCVCVCAHVWVSVCASIHAHSCVSAYLCVCVYVCISLSVCVCWGEGVLCENECSMYCFIIFCIKVCSLQFQWCERNPMCKIDNLSLDDIETGENWERRSYLGKTFPGASVHYVKVDHCLCTAVTVKAVVDDCST